MNEVDTLGRAEAVPLEQYLRMAILTAQVPWQQPRRIGEFGQRAGVCLRMPTTGDDGRMRDKQRHVSELRLHRRRRRPPYHEIDGAVAKLRLHDAQQSFIEFQL